MKPPTDSDRGATPEALWKPAIIIVLVGLYAAWLEWNSFANVDFSELAWLGAVAILSILVCSRYLKQKSLSPAFLVAFGTLLWSIWRFTGWVFTARQGLVIGFFGLLTAPIRLVFGLRMPPAELVILGVAFATILLSFAGSFWIHRHIDIRWLRRSKPFWGLLLLIGVVVAVYVNQPHFEESCFGVVAYSQGLSCQLHEKLGTIASIWVTLTFLLWGLTYGLRQANSSDLLAVMWVVALVPVSIAMFFNPARILGVALLAALRSPGEYSELELLLASNMRTLNLIPIFTYFLIIPLGLLLLRSERPRFWWAMSMSTISLSVMLARMIQGLDAAKPIFSYSAGDQVVFVLMALQVWLPLVIVSLAGNSSSSFPQRAHSTGTEQTTSASD